LVLRHGQLVEARWKTVVVGEIIKLENDQFVAVLVPLVSCRFNAFLNHNEQ